MSIYEKNNKKKCKNIKRLKKTGDRDFHLYDNKPIYEVGGFISEDEFKYSRKVYEKKRPYKDSKGNIIKSQLFGLGNFHNLINQPGAHGIRIYYGMKKVDKNWMPQLMIVAVYKDGKDMVEHTHILDQSLPCPSYCPDDQ